MGGEGNVRQRTITDSITLSPARPKQCSGRTTDSCRLESVRLQTALKVQDVLCRRCACRRCASSLYITHTQWTPTEAAGMKWVKMVDGNACEGKTCVLEWMCFDLLFCPGYCNLTKLKMQQSWHVMYNVYICTH